MSRWLAKYVLGASGCTQPIEIPGQYDGSTGVEGNVLRWGLRLLLNWCVSRFEARSIVACENRVLWGEASDYGFHSKAETAFNPRQR
jgi:hypothetical protein